MSRIRGKDTTPEKVVRSLLRRMGYRFRLHAKKPPGRPDIVLPRHKTVMFVHGCFCHHHRGCTSGTKPGCRLRTTETITTQSARGQAHSKTLCVLQARGRAWQRLGVRWVRGWGHTPLSLSSLSSATALTTGQARRSPLQGHNKMRAGTMPGPVNLIVPSGHYGTSRTP